MKISRHIVVFCTAVLLAACSSARKTPPAAMTPIESARVASTPAATPPAPKPTTASSVAPVAVPAYLDPKNPISTERSVYFDFDDASIRKDYFSLIERQGRYLAAQPSLNVKIEGSTDERGGAEYNLALGQRRAEAVLRALMVYGAKDSQMEAISWGRGKPKASGHDETAWAQNRRADVVYPAR